MDVRCYCILLLYAAVRQVGSIVPSCANSIADIPYNEGIAQRLTASANKSINSIQFLGAHNAGAYTDSSIGAIFNCYSRNQNHPFRNMLNMGIRYLDVDVCYHQGVLKFCHSGWPYNEWTSHFFARIEDGLNDIRCFLEQHSKDIIFLHFNRDWHAYGLPDSERSMAITLYNTLVGYLSHQMFPLEPFYIQNQRLPTVDELWSADRRLIVFIHRRLYKHAHEDMAADAVEGPADANTWIDIIYMAYRAVSTPTGMTVKDKKLGLVDMRCRHSNSAFIDFQVIGRLYNLHYCLEQINNATQDILPEALNQCRMARCTASRSEAAVNFLTVDFVEAAPVNLLEVYNFGDCTQPYPQSLSNELRYRTPSAREYY